MTELALEVRLPFQQRRVCSLFDVQAAFEQLVQQRPRAYSLTEAERLLLEANAVPRLLREPACVGGRRRALAHFRLTLATVKTTIRRTGACSIMTSCDTG